MHADEIQPAVEELLAGKGVANHDQVYARLDPALSRFEALEQGEQEKFRELLKRFVSLYGFIAQIVRFTDVKLERDYVYSRALQSRLPGQDIERIDIGSEVALTHLRTEQREAGSASLVDGDGTISAIFSGKGKQNDPDNEHLSAIIEALNEKFGTNLNEQDQLLFDQFEQTWLTNPDVMAQARNNEFENFRLVFDRMFLDTVVGRMDENEAIFKRVLDDSEFQETLMGLYAARVYRRLRDIEVSAN
jgi:type I restriction enzyme R subunit